MKTEIKINVKIEDEEMTITHKFTPELNLKNLTTEQKYQIVIFNAFMKVMHDLDDEAEE